MFQRTRYSLSFFSSPSSLFRPSSLLLIQFGVIRKWDAGSRFGFVRDDSSNSSIFVHRSNCVWQNPQSANQSILVDTRVGYDLTLDEKKNDGSLRCENVTLEDGSPLPDGTQADRPRPAGDNNKRISAIDNDIALRELIGKTDLQGKIKFFNKTFGFIEFADPRDESKVLSIFAHRQHVIQEKDHDNDDQRLEKGTQVVFDVCDDTKKPTTAQAMNISVKKVPAEQKQSLFSKRKSQDEYDDDDDDDDEPRKSVKRSSVAATNRNDNDSAVLELVGKTGVEGEIKFFHNTFGFITFPDPRGEVKALSIFAHRQDIVQEAGQEKNQPLQPGDRVVFDVSNDAKKPNFARATNISKKKHLNRSRGLSRSDNDRALLELVGKTDLEGKIANFGKTFGFIEFPDVRDKSNVLSIFAHLDDVIPEQGEEKGQPLQAEDRVMFDVSNDNKKSGAVRATNISKKMVLGESNNAERVTKKIALPSDDDESEF